MVSLFWISCAIVAYVYVGYPALLMVWARLRPRRDVLSRRNAAATERRTPDGGRQTKGGPETLRFPALIRSAIICVICE